MLNWTEPSGLVQKVDCQIFGGSETHPVLGLGPERQQGRAATEIRVKGLGLDFCRSLCK